MTTLEGAILVVGNEILSGRTQDSNAFYLAQRLHESGHRVRRITVVEDDPFEIALEVEKLLRRFPLLVVTGGLGPTHDDRTTEGIERALRRGLKVEEGWLQRIEETHRLGVLLDREGLRKMATIPHGALPLPNPVGSALGYALVLEGRTLVVLPGVPKELRAIFEEHVLGTIVPRGSPPTTVEVRVLSREITFSDVLSRIQGRYPGVLIGSYPHLDPPSVSVRFEGKREEVLKAALELREELSKVGIPFEG